MNTDWKDMLAGLRQDADPAPDADNTTAEPAPAADAPKKQKINMALERKGRGGKTATILYGFLCSDSELQEIAKTLKTSLGCGGSARGGEILLQGDRRDQVKELLTKKYPHLHVGK